MNKKDVLHTHNGILLSYEKEQNDAIFSDMDGHTGDHAKRCRSERERQTPTELTAMWNLI